MGNTLTRPSENAAIDYDEDQSKIEVLNFSLSTVGPGRLGSCASQARDREGAGRGRKAGTASVTRRPRMFSTFVSAAKSQSTDGTRSWEDRVKLSEIVASGGSVVMDPGEYTAECVFVRRRAHYDFVVHCPDGLTNLRGLFCKNLSSEQYDAVVVGKSIPDGILLMPNLQIEALGDFDAPPQDAGGRPEKVMHSHDRQVFIPEGQAGRRALYFIMIHDASNSVLLKARAVVIGQEDKDRLAYIGQHMCERDLPKCDLLIREISNLVSRLPAISLNKNSLLEFLGKVHGVAKPPIHLILGRGATLLAHRTFKPVNQSAITCNILFMSTDPVFLEHIAMRISTEFPIRVILADLRGFGYSGGRRGETPSVEDVYRDIDQLVSHIRGISAQPIILGGYFFTCGMVTNYVRWRRRSLAVSIDGLLLISPMLGWEWRSTWKKETVDRMLNEKIVTRHRGRFAVAQLTNGLIWGKRTVLKFKVTDDMTSLWPTLISRITANYLICTQVPREGGAAFRRLKCPVGVLIGSDDDFLDAAKIRAALKEDIEAAGQQGKFIECSGLDGMRLLITGHGKIAEWVLGLDSVRVASDAILMQRRGGADGELGGVVAILSGKIRSGLLQGIGRVASVAFSERARKMTNCFPGQVEPFEAFEPLQLPGRPKACLVVLAPLCLCAFLPDLAASSNIQVFRVNPWITSGKKGEGRASSGGGGSFSKSPAINVQIFKAVKNIIRIVKVNFPGAPIFLSGIGYGANVAIQYNACADREPVNGYILIAPIVRNGGVAGDGQEVAAGNEVAIGECLSLIYGERIEGDPFASVGVDARLRLGLLSKRQSALLLGSCTVESIAAIDTPLCIVLPSQHAFLDYGQLYDDLSPRCRAPFRSVTLLEGLLAETLEGGAPGAVGEWLGRVSTSLGASATEHAVLLHTRLNDIDVIEMIGRGSYGRVWLVRHLPTGRFLAVKVFEKASVIEHGQTLQVVRERQILAECSSCPFIVPFAGTFQSPTRLYLMMDFVVGGELYTRLGRTGPLSVGAARFYMCEVIAALAYMHDRSLVYRDVKPENILLDALGHVRLVDFGFARRLNDLGRCTSFCGSPFYIAPEMLTSSSYGPSVDIWALGVLLYELLVGDVPFTGETANEVYRHIIFSKFSIPSDVEGDARDLIRRLLDVNPDTRLGVEGGIRQVMRHRFFRTIDWDLVSAKQLVPPYAPSFTFDGDTVNFAKYTQHAGDFNDSSTSTDDRGHDGGGGGMSRRLNRSVAAAGNAVGDERMLFAEF